MPFSDNNLRLFPKQGKPSGFDPLFYESMARKNGYQLIAGVDEVGRGPLAGPVVAAAVILPEDLILSGIQDSKKMTPKGREKAFEVIDEHALAIGIGVVSHRFIDKTNILTASLEAMKQAVSFLEPAPQYVLVDGIHKFPDLIPQKCIKKGDQLSLSISAASVIAKVYRDNIMCSLNERFPEFGFCQHKGYGTARHLEALKHYGPCPVHRRSFKGVC